MLVMLAVTSSDPSRFPSGDLDVSPVTLARAELEMLGKGQD